MVRDLFLLDESIAYLNHGGMGAVPRPVLEKQEAILRRIEKNPTGFYMDELRDELDRAIVPVAKAVGAEAGELAFTTNATHGLNLIGRSLMDDLEPGDEVIVTDLEYGSQRTLWEWLCKRQKATCRQVELFGVAKAEVVEALGTAVTGQTRIVLVSHITSATARRLPVAEIAARLHELGVTLVVDGAHVPGQIPLDLKDLGCDYFVGNLHKWYSAPRGTAILYASKEAQRRLDPLIVNWGGVERSAPMAERIHIPGTADASAWLAAPVAVEFHDTVLEPEREAARALLEETAEALSSLGYERIGERSDDLMMSSFLLPDGVGPERLAGRLREDGIVAIVVPLAERSALRICVAWYTTQRDIDRLLESLSRL